MKYHLATVCAWIALPAAALSQTSLINGNGVTYQFGEWTRPAVLGLASTSGDAQVIRRSCKVTIQYPGRPQIRNLDLLFYPAGNELWIGEATGHYVISNEKIWALRVTGVTLSLSMSQPAGDFSTAQDANLEAFLKKFVTDPRTLLWTDGSVKTLVLPRVFGFGAIYGAAREDYIRPYLELTGLEAGPKGVTITFKVLQANFALSLTLGPDLTVTEARVGGDSIPVLFGSFSIPAGLERWSPPTGISVPSPSGALAALLCGRSYTALDASTNEVTLARANAVVLTSTGDLWSPEFTVLSAKVVPLGSRELTAP